MASMSSDALLSRVAALDAFQCVYRFGDQYYLIRKRVNPPEPVSFFVRESDHLGRPLKGATELPLCSGVDTFSAASASLRVTVKPKPVKRRK